MKSKIISRVERVTSTGKKIAEVKLQSGRWLQIWEKNYDNTINPIFLTAIVGKMAKWEKEMKENEKRPGYYRPPADLVIEDEQPVVTPTAPTAPAAPAARPQTPTAPQRDEIITRRMEEREQRIREMADRRDQLTERQIAALDRATAAIEKLVAVIQTLGVRPPTPYPDGYTATEADLENQPEDTFPEDDEPGY